MSAKRQNGCTNSKKTILIMLYSWLTFWSLHNRARGGIIPYRILVGIDINTREMEEKVLQDKSLEESIDMQVKDMAGSLVPFRLKRKTSLHKVKIAYCARKGLKIDEVSFYFAGILLLDVHTPANVGIADGTVIDVVTHNVEPEMLILEVKGVDGKVVHFKIKIYTQLLKLMDTFCATTKWQMDHIKFFFRGVRVHGNQTPQDLGMQNNDVIIVKSITINVQAKDMTGSILFFRLLKNTPLHEFKAAYCARTGLWTNALSFYFAGILLEDTSTPPDVGIDDGAVIDVVPHHVEPHVEMLILEVKDVDGEVVRFKIKKHTKLLKLMETFCAKQKCEAERIEFFFQGVRVHGSQTPQDLGMKNNDQIDSNSIDINLKVKGVDGEFLHFKINKYSKLRKLMEAFCARTGVQMEQTTFLYQSRRIRDAVLELHRWQLLLHEDTPAECQMKMDDLIITVAMGRTA